MQLLGWCIEGRAGVVCILTLEWLAFRGLSLDVFSVLERDKAAPTKLNALLRKFWGSDSKSSSGS